MARRKKAEPVEEDEEIVRGDGDAGPDHPDDYAPYPVWPYDGMRYPVYLQTEKEANIFRQFHESDDLEEAMQTCDDKAAHEGRVCFVRDRKRVETVHRFDPNRKEEEATDGRTAGKRMGARKGGKRQ